MSDKPTHLHIKSGHKIVKIAVGRLQTSKPITDMTPLVFYKEGNNWWARPIEEFEDGRFEKLDDEQKMDPNDSGGVI